MSLVLLEIRENSSNEWSSQGESVGQNEKCFCTWSPVGSTVVRVLGDAALPLEVKSLEWGWGGVRYLQPYPACSFSPLFCDNALRCELSACLSLPGAFPRHVDSYLSGIISSNRLFL